MDVPIPDRRDEPACYAQLVECCTPTAWPARVAMFEWGDNVQRVTETFVQALLGVRSATICPT